MITILKKNLPYKVGDPMPLRQPQMLKKLKSINHKVRPPAPLKGVNSQSFNKFINDTEISTHLGGQPRSGRGYAYLVFFVVKKKSRKANHFIIN